MAYRSFLEYVVLGTDFLLPVSYGLTTTTS